MLPSAWALGEAKNGNAAKEDVTLPKGTYIRIAQWSIKEKSLINDQKFTAQEKGLQGL